MGLTHIDERGKAKMVDVTAKDVTERRAVASCSVTMRPETLELVLANEMKKGDVLGVARIAGIMAAKRTDRIIPLCHPLNITSVDVDFRPDRDTSSIAVSATVKVASRTGVEMEALTAVSAAALTIYDMCKAVDKEMVISDIRLEEKSGGRSGEFRRRG
ncbi:MAG TPA: cyclic pyranopterin monophosphate synthase MoaC [Deltaproteobacteria bacterium]|nr:cyclic pyranopterin monophosphate synthase MoaC [Deltaproteobacteria bacterium]